MLGTLSLSNIFFFYHSPALNVVLGCWVWKCPFELQEKMSGKPEVKDVLLLSSLGEIERVFARLETDEVRWGIMPSVRFWALEADLLFSSYRLRAQRKLVGELQVLLEQRSHVDAQMSSLQRIM